MKNTIEDLPKNLVSVCENDWNNSETRKEILASICRRNRGQKPLNKIAFDKNIAIIKYGNGDPANWDDNN